jgi:hypothetical protein
MVIAPNLSSSALVSCHSENDAAIFDPKLYVVDETAITTCHFVRLLVPRNRPDFARPAPVNSKLLNVACHHCPLRIQVVRARKAPAMVTRAIHFLREFTNRKLNTLFPDLVKAGLDEEPIGLLALVGDLARAGRRDAKGVDEVGEGVFLFEDALAEDITHAMRLRAFSSIE